MPRPPLHLVLVFLCGTAAVQAEAGQSYSTHGYARSGGPSGGHSLPQFSYRSWRTPQHGVHRSQGSYQRDYYPTYPAYPVYPAQSAYRFGRTAPLPSTHTYGYYDFSQRRKCVGPCSDGRNHGGYRQGYRDGYRDGNRERDDGREDGRRCRGEDC